MNVSNKMCYSTNLRYLDPVPCTLKIVLISFALNIANGTIFQIDFDFDLHCCFLKDLKKHGKYLKTIGIPHSYLMSSFNSERTCFSFALISKTSRKYLTSEVPFIFSFLMTISTLKTKEKKIFHLKNN